MSGQPYTADQYIYQVHPSYKSETSIRITRRLAPQSQVDTFKTQQENPYVFKPKSYSRKRVYMDTISSTQAAPPPTKKFKSNSSNKSKPIFGNILDGKYIQDKLNDFTCDYFTASFKKNTKIEEEKQFKLPFVCSNSQRKNKNPQLSHKIEIVSTNNQKILISIHDGLLKANTNHSKQEQSLDGIVNPFNKTLKSQFSDSINFIRDYKSGYTPIQLQNKSKKEDEDEGGYQEKKKQKVQGSNSKAHFIKKKQSTLSLPRTCGVSYIKPTESFQGPPYEPLPPLIFQCSTSCNYTNQLRQIYHPQIQRLINLSENKWLPAILTTQQYMRDVLLGKPYGKVIWVEGLVNLWPLFNQGIFILVFFHEQFASTEEQVWNQFSSCYFKFGILAKKSTSGKKLFLKSIQGSFGDKEETMTENSFGVSCEQKMNKSLQNITDLIKTEHQQIGEGSIGFQRIQSRIIQEKKLQDSPSEERKQCKDVYEQFMKQLKTSRTVLTMSLKLQMYVHEQFWKGLSLPSRNILNAIIHSFQEHLQTKVLEVIKDRLELAKGIEREHLLGKALHKLRVGGNLSQFKLEEKKHYEKESVFTLDTLIELNQKLEQRIVQKPGENMTANELFKDKDGRQNFGAWQKFLKFPIYYISTRDSFAFDMVENITLLKRGERTYKKIVYNFQPSNVPTNFGEYKKLFPDLFVGAICYHDFFSEEELQFFEAQTLQTERSAFKNKFLHMTVQPTIVGNRIKRTKFFFGYRYMWTRCQLAEPNSYVGAGVRRDVTPAPKWLQKVENPMVENGILEPNFLNSVALNVYHDGTEGLAQHFDDAVRFKQPIYTLRLVSDGRLSFGSQFYGFCNGAFIIPLPRGCICVMTENSYAANGVKHCVRPCDMSGKSAAIILRQMHHQVVKQAAKYDEFIDFPAWLSTMSEDPRAVSFAEQKRRQAEHILVADDQKKEKEKQAKIKPVV